MQDSMQDKVATLLGTDICRNNFIYSIMYSQCVKQKKNQKKNTDCQGNVTIKIKQDKLT